MRRFVTVARAMMVVGVFALIGGPLQVSAGTGEANQVIDFETMFASLDADGTPRNVRLIDTLRVIGTGDVVVTDPTSTEDYRVLSGFSDPQIGDGEVTYTVEGLDGEEEFVAVSTPDVEPPASMLVTYLLEGERVEPEDLLGRSGDVQVVFDVSNNTSEPRELTYRDGSGERQTVTEEVPLPMVAQLQMELPGEHFSRIEAPEAEKVTSSRGDITLLWNLVLVPPIGDTVQSVEVAMEAEDFELGPVRLTAVPVAPRNREFLAFAEDEFAEGRDSAAGLYEGSTELGASMEDLHDGTLALLEGMNQLFTGARELAAGLGEAFAGSGKLTAGLNEARAGSGELSAGLGDAEAGSGKITGGLGDLRGGMKQIGGGLDEVGGGLGQMAAALPAGQAGAMQIAEAAQGIQTIAAGLAANLTSGPTSIAGGATGIGNIAGSVGPPLQTAAALCDADPDCVAIQTAMLTAHACLVGASCGPNPTISQIASSLAAGATAIAACLTGGGTPCSGNPSVDSIAGLIEAGALELAAGIGDAIEGVAQLSDGIEQLSDGMSEALDGVSQLHEGSRELTGGLGDAVEGSRALTVGLGEAASGSGKLTAGLGEASSGSGRLAEGIGEARNGTKQIEQGVYAVNELGLQEIARGANETAAELSRGLALMKAQDQRAATESLTYGPPSADNAQTVVGGSSIVLTMDQLDNRAAESTGRGIASILGFLALVGLGFLGARRLAGAPA